LDSLDALHLHFLHFLQELLNYLNANIRDSLISYISKSHYVVP
jgi:hypothetical protein